MVEFEGGLPFFARVSEREQAGRRAERDRAALYVCDYSALRGLTVDDAALLLRMLDIHPGRHQ